MKISENDARSGFAARPAGAGLGTRVIGFVERGASPAEPCVQMPFATPVVHLPLNGAPAPMFARGSAEARVAAGGPGPVFVIALGTSGAGTLFPDIAAGGFVPAEDVFWSDLQGRLAEADTFAARAAIAEAALAERLADAAPSRTLRAADAIVHDRWRGSVAALADAFGVEERTLRNRFRRETGWAPKALLRVARFNRALRALHPRSWAGRPAADVRLEFSDDAHFHREFTGLAGLTPRAFVAVKKGDPALHTVRGMSSTSSFHSG